MPQHQHENHRSTKGPGKIIAVGGAKGGIGKSLFVANLGVLLSQLGKKTVLVDLDLGASNLHLYMGLWSLPHCIDDFLNKTVSCIDDIMVPTKYGPRLIGGSGCKLGDANIHFSRKVKLLRAIKDLDADYVIIDLGGDTTYNILDFYLAADQGLILTTCEPASYMDAYGFIKLSLQRKLTRLFGAESVHYKNSDRHLEQLIRDFFFSKDTAHARHISNLLSHLENEYPSQVPFVKKVIDDFRPATIVTMIQAQAQVDELVTRLKNVSRKILSIDLDYFGCLPFESQVQQSAVDLVPYVSRTSNGNFTKALRRITLRMEMV
ncbi:ATP-binding protein [Desulfosarcina variabilis str. Montpellier]|uniref:AAA family ATPase n=1 Tax=Desulfosarcina variabilis TaxID=2300 RepID=UPI003AFA98FB